MPGKQKIERHTENLGEKEMKISGYGENEYGYVYVQGELTPVSAINEALKTAGGKPKECAIDDYSKGGNGKAFPEYIITFKKDLNTIIVVECKNSVKKHGSPGFSRPRDFAIDGVLYYAKYLKLYFNVIAVAISGTDKTSLKVNAYYWIKNQDTYTELIKARDIILEPENYLKLVYGERVQKAYSLEEISQTAISMHESLRINKMTEKLKPLFVAGVLIALQDDSFCNGYDKLTSFSSLLNSCCQAIENVLNGGEIEEKKIREIKGKLFLRRW